MQLLAHNRLAPKRHTLRRAGPRFGQVSNWPNLAAPLHKQRPETEWPPAPLGALRLGQSASFGRQSASCQSTAVCTSSWRLAGRRQTLAQRPIGCHKARSEWAKWNGRKRGREESSLTICVFLFLAACVAFSSSSSLSAGPSFPLHWRPPRAVKWAPDGELHALISALQRQARESHSFSLGQSPAAILQPAHRLTLLLARQGSHATSGPSGASGTAASGWARAPSAWAKWWRVLGRKWRRLVGVEGGPVSEVQGVQNGISCLWLEGARVNGHRLAWGRSDWAADFLLFFGPSFAAHSRLSRAACRTKTNTAAQWAKAPLASCTWTNWRPIGANVCSSAGSLASGPLPVQGQPPRSWEINLPANLVL